MTPSPRQRVASDGRRVDAGDDLVDELSRTTSALATAGQVAEVVGPLLGALCVSWFGPRRGACAAGVLNIASSAPAQAVLDSLLQGAPS